MICNFLCAVDVVESAQDFGSVNTQITADSPPLLNCVPSVCCTFPLHCSARAENLISVDIVVMINVMYSVLRKYSLNSVEVTVQISSIHVPIGCRFLSNSKSKFSEIQREQRANLLELITATITTRMV